MDSTPSKESLRERAARAHLDKLWRRGAEFLGCRYAILGGAMTWVSDRHLVSAISNGGGFGIIASGSMSPNLLSAEIAATAAMTTRPFGVNLITGMFFFVGQSAQYTASSVFYWKIIFLMIAGANFLYLTVFGKAWRRTEGGDARFDASLADKAMAVLSMAAWLAVLYAGRMLPFLGRSF